MSNGHDEDGPALATMQGNSAGTGLITRPREQYLSPAIAAEQQRAKSEIEAMLTIAAARPRDEKRAFDAIMVSCQRPGLAERAEYEYSRGGTAIVGASIDLMEVIAAKWCNIWYGFRELSRHVGIGGQPGESMVEAFAWDMETNTKRQTQFIVNHAERTKKGLRIIADQRDVYEWVANQAQRRVRVCLENVVPRDVVDAARDQCRLTLETKEQVTPDKLQKLLQAFEAFGVTKAMLEAKLQRGLETMSPAQMVRMRRIFTSLKDRVAEPSDFFEVEADKGAAPKTATEAAKEALRQKAAQKAAEPTPEQPENQDADPPQQEIDFNAAEEEGARIMKLAAAGKTMEDFDFVDTQISAGAPKFGEKWVNVMNDANRKAREEAAKKPVEAKGKKGKTLFAGQQ